MSKRFMNSNSLYNTNDSASWSDTDGFYKRVNWLSTEAHSSSNDDDDIVDYFMCLEQLHIEIEGTIKNSDDREELEKKRKQIYNDLLSDAYKNKKLLFKRNKIGEYHRLINKLAHKYGLYLRKTISQSLDSWDNE